MPLKLPVFLRGLRFQIILYSSMFLQVMGQDIAIGQWRSHLSFRNANDLAVAGNKVFVTATGSLFSFNNSTSELQLLTKAEGLSDFGATCVAYDSSSSTVVVGYANANIDLIKDEKIINIPAISKSSITGNKTINDITARNGKAYLSCGFGIVVVDLRKQEIEATYLIGNNGSQVNVNTIIFSPDSVYAGTSAGIYAAKADNPFLSDFNNWKKENYLPSTNHFAICWFDNKLFSVRKTSQTTTYIYFREKGTNNWQKWDSTINFNCLRLKDYGNTLMAVYDGSVYLYNKSRVLFEAYFGYFGASASTDAEYDADKNVWIADKFHSLVKRTTDGNFHKITPQGPPDNNIRSLSYDSGNLWVAPGGAVGTSNGFRILNISRMNDNGDWSFLDGGYIYNKTTCYDLMVARVNPRNSNQCFVGTWSNGLLEVDKDSILNHYTKSNSTLDSAASRNSTWIQGMDFDLDGNLWISNAFTQKPLVMLSADKRWYSYAFPGYTIPPVLQLIATSSGQKWILSEKMGAFVYGDAATPENISDDKFRLLGFELGKGGIPGSEVFALCEDLNGAIWIGTDKGVGVVFSPQSVFDPAGYDAEQIKIEMGGYVQYLLESETVTAIEVDDANRKWIGTAQSGVFLISPDGTEQLEHFTQETSPLVSNSINDIEINRRTGEVFIATEKGLVSYKGTATRSYPECEDVLVYPNPVREDYSGPIAIRGLVQGAEVKITDAAGTLVYQTTSLGGQALWNGINLRGEKAHTGIYFVFAATKDGSTGCSTKFMLIR
ncbi:MAG: hypothetical protein ACK5CO_07175 [Bacteroidota bacterium]